MDRPTLKRFRAVVRQIELDGPDGKHWGTGELFQSLTGYANFVAMVAPEKGIPLQKQVAHLKRQYNIPVAAGKITALNKRLFRLKAVKGEAPREAWWQPAEKPAPVLALTQQQMDAQKQQARQAAKANQANTHSAHPEMAPDHTNPAFISESNETNTASPNRFGSLLCGR
ncbi:retron-type RNA-directed DNA polymerase [Photobacterium aphoticum]|uniref:Retron-type RNA-directed DNA polymerase n=1 Tax=Photobacterium aphoticum TaxID=754436 RepID=A0A090RGJ8_9GAMM|nr:retron-type RNA-directed DNA polymerase [Photobacterium aphoticum]